MYQVVLSPDSQVSFIRIAIRCCYMLCAWPAINNYFLMEVPLLAEYTAYDHICKPVAIRRIRPAGLAALLSSCTLLYTLQSVLFIYSSFKTKLKMVLFLNSILTKMEPWYYNSYTEVLKNKFNRPHAFVCKPLRKKNLNYWQFLILSKLNFCKTSE